MATDKEKEMIMNEYLGGFPDYDDEDDEAEFNPSEDESDEDESDEESEEEEKEVVCVLNGSLHLNDEGRVVYSGTYDMNEENDEDDDVDTNKNGDNAKNNKKKHKFKLKSKQIMCSSGPKNVFDLCNPIMTKTTCRKHHHRHRSMLFDGFFFHTDEKEQNSGHSSSHSHGRKVKERDIEIIFSLPESSDNDEKEGKNGTSEDTKKLSEPVKVVFSPPESSDKDEKEGKNGTSEDKKKLSEPISVDTTQSNPTDDKNDSTTPEKENRHFVIHGRGCNEFGSFILEGDYKVEVELKNNQATKEASDDKQENTTTTTSTNDKNNASSPSSEGKSPVTLKALSNTFICYKRYQNENQIRAARAAKDGGDATKVSIQAGRRNHRRQRRKEEESNDDDDDDDELFAADDGADFDELIALNEEANLDVEELRKRYMSDAIGGEDGGSSLPPAKRSKKDPDVSEDDEVGF